jgi:hypothetical protein
MRGETPPSPVAPLAFETLYWKLETHRDLVRVGARTEDLKYVRNVRGSGPQARVREELYDLVRDPDERENLLAEGRQPPSEHRRALEALREEAITRLAELRLAEPVPLSPEVEQRLKSLGYLQ